MHCHFNRLNGLFRKKKPQSPYDTQSGIKNWYISKKSKPYFKLTKTIPWLMCNVTTYCCVFIPTGCSNESGRTFHLLLNSCKTCVGSILSFMHSLLFSHCRKQKFCEFCPYPIIGLFFWFVLKLYCEGTL